MRCSRRSGLELPFPWGFAVLNDRPVACHIRGPTDPQGDRWHGEAVTDEVFHPQAVPPPDPAAAAAQEVQAIP